MKIVTSSWNEYELLDSGDGMRLERFGIYRLIRPDPQVLWHKRNVREWENYDALFESTNKTGWFKRTNIPSQWQLHFNKLAFFIKLSPFKHTGVFPEQAAQWSWITEKIKERSQPTQVLNLFAYTGAATLVAAASGASVTHVDASKPTISWARENQRLSHLEDEPIRWIFDDVMQFVKREIKRGKKYDAIIMDPPVYGHGKDGQRWDFMKDFPALLSLCKDILSPNPLFLLVNAYAISASSLMLENVMREFTQPFGGVLESGELAIQESGTAPRLLSTGIFSRWSSQ